MLDTNIKKISFGGKNALKWQHLHLDGGMECVVVLSMKDERILELLYNKILDVLIDRIHPKDVYKDFSSALESINSFLMTWRKDEENLRSLSAIIGVQHKKNFYFSTIGKSSAYLHNSQKNIVEVTDKTDNTKFFNFISSWELASGESMILSNVRLLDTLSHDDMRDAFEFGWALQAGDSIESILLREHEGKNIINCILQRKFLAHEDSSNKYLEKCKYFLLRIADNNIIKSWLGRVYQLRDKLLSQKKQNQQILLWVGVLVLTYILFRLLSGFFQIASETSSTEVSKKSLFEAQKYVVTASENMNDSDVFSYNIEKADEIIADLQSKEVFSADLQKLQSDISLLQKKMNGIEVFTANDTNTLYTSKEKLQAVAVVKLSWKKYVVTPNSVLGSIIKWETVKEYNFPELSTSDSFLSATSLDNNIIITTKEGKVVRFTTGNTFSYINVKDQSTWSLSPVIESYGRNIYMLSDNKKQILRHQKSGNDFTKADEYLKEQDALDIGKIFDIAIDGGIYILKSDGTMLKLFRAPKYRLESLSLNKLPKNYDFSSVDMKSAPKIQTRANLKYVYMYLDGKILIFKPNTFRMQDVKSLTYLGQLEGSNIDIQSFYIENDSELIVTGETGVYKINFEINKDGELLVK